MASLNPSKLEKRYYTIGEVAEMFNVNSSLLRYWEKEFPIIEPKKNRKGNRVYTSKNIADVKYIYFLVKEQGHTLEGAKKIVKKKSHKENRDFQLSETLKKLRSLLIDIREELNQ